CGSSVAQPVNRPKGGEEGVSENPRPTGTMASRRDPRAALLDESYASSEVSSATDGTGSRGDEDERDGEAPAVFFCGKCRLPVGDSLSWAGSEEERNQILLQRVNNNIIVGKEPYLDPVQKRLGCLIVNLTCRGCCSVLGMMYVSTPKKLDHKRSLFCLNVESIDSYVIGSTDQEVADLSCEGTPVTLEYQERVEQQMTEVMSAGPDRLFLYE
uniref:Protein Mis18-alpha n=1 Tax=Denticeps clupeoides TaxID=299321 RepID=A0AAY4EAE1_9TELE